MLIICLIYCDSLDKDNIYGKRLIDSLFNCVNDCLGDNNESHHNNTTHDDNDEKETTSIYGGYGRTRNYYYFKRFLLFSNIWNIEYNNNLLFDKFEVISQQQLLKQKQSMYIECTYVTVCVCLCN